MMCIKSKEMVDVEVEEMVVSGSMVAAALGVNCTIEAKETMALRTTEMVDIK